MAFRLGQFSPNLKQTTLFLKLPPFLLFNTVFHLSQNFRTHHLLSFSICSISSHSLLHSQHSKPWSSSCQLYWHFLALPAYFLVASETTGNLLLLGIISPLGFQDNLFSWFSLFALSASSQSPSWPLSLCLPFKASPVVCPLGPCTSTWFPETAHPLRMLSSFVIYKHITLNPEFRFNSTNSFWKFTVC